MPRDQIIRAFLGECGWQNAVRRPIAGDASARRYFRLSNGTESRVLMDAPPNLVTTQRPFVDAAGHLRTIGLCAPEVFHADLDNGLILMEDLGDMPLPKAISAGRISEAESYQSAVDVLVHLQNRPAPAWLQPYGPAEMVAALDPFFAAVAPDMPADTQAAIINETEHLPQRHCADRHVMILRDYHAENILWQTNATTIGQVGLIDFQDALLSHPVYDFISLLKDARRAVQRPTEKAMIRQFLNATDMGPDQFAVSAALLTLQRNLRILGLFHHLNATGKPGYMAFVPQVTGYITEALSHPALQGLGQLLNAHISTSRGAARCP